MIREVYKWEDCTESSVQFQTAATKLEDDFSNEKEHSEAEDENESSAEESDSDDGSYESSFVSKSGSESETESVLDTDDEKVKEVEAARKQEAAGEEAWSPSQHGPRHKRRREEEDAEETGPLWTPGETLWTPGEPSWTPGEPSWTQDTTLKRTREAVCSPFASPGRRMSASPFAEWTPGCYGADVSMDGFASGRDQVFSGETDHVFTDAALCDTVVFGADDASGALETRTDIFDDPPTLEREGSCFDG